MQIFKKYSDHLLFSLLFVSVLFASGCGSATTTTTTTTTTVADTVAPTVISTTPVDNDTNASLNKSISALLSEAIDHTTVTSTSFTLVQGTTNINGIVSYASNTMIFDPDADLSPSTLYTATITTAVKDTAGNAMAINFVWSFTTGTTADTTAPTVTSIDPDANATGVPYNRSVSTLFSEALDPTTITTTTFLLKQGTADINGTVSYESDTMIFDPKSDLQASTVYTATITTGVKDLAGNALVADHVWSFTTGATAVAALAAVDLGSAGNYVILAKTAISTTGTTAITGHLAISPAARTYITGFSDTLSTDGTYATSNLVTGRLYASNMAVPTPANLTTAVSDMETAYTNAAGRTLPDHTELGAGDVSGMTLAPGLYKWGTGLLITNAGVTISGGATDIWIFQIAGDLTLNSGAIVTLAGGALAKNIFWQVAGGTGVSLGTTADLKGVVLAQKGIVVNTGAKVKGRLLAQTAVTLNGNAITQP